jgi:hypothetical protein
MLANIFNLETHTWDPMEAVDIAAGPRLDPEMLGGNYDMAIAVGLATRLGGS